jgi:LysR family transcriptional regulator, glycine cleavage system transcriptional activator
MRRLPPLHALRAFEAAARHLSFQEAAAELHVTPTAISHQVRLLEEICGHQLFRRRPRPITLTGAGQALFPALRDALDRMAGAVASLGPTDRTRSVRVSTTVLFASRWLIPRLPSWRAAHPGCELEIVTTYGLSDLRAEAIDVAIRFGRAPPEDLDSEFLFEDRFLPVASADICRQGTAIVDFPLIHYRWKRQRTLEPTWARWVAAASPTDPTASRLDPTKGLRFSDESNALDACLAGQGVVLASAVLASHALASGALKVVSPTTLPGLPCYAVRVPGGGPHGAALVAWLRSLLDQDIAGHMSPSAVAAIAEE